MFTPLSKRWSHLLCAVNGALTNTKLQSRMGEGYAGYPGLKGRLRTGESPLVNIDGKRAYV